MKFMKDYEKIKVIFLDIDGVLNGGYQTEMTNRYYNLDSEKIKLLNQIIEKTTTDDCPTKIVLSSTWRLDFTDKKIDFAGHAIDMFFEAVGIIPCCIGRTGYYNTRRGNEIFLWLARYQLTGDKEIESICILDDDRDMEMMKPWHIQIDYKQGLTMSNVNDAVKMLYKPWGYHIGLLGDKL